VPRRRVVARRPEEGQSTVELALLLPVIVVLLLSVLQVGLVARDIVLVTHASREAARAAAVDGSMGAAERAATAATGLDVARLDVSVTGRAGPGSRVRVVVTYRSPTSVPLVGALLGDHPIRSSATMRVEGAA
jgi:Flp pilus assembly protein TadG